MASDGGGGGGGMKSKQQKPGLPLILIILQCSALLATILDIISFSSQLTLPSVALFLTIYFKK